MKAMTYAVLPLVAALALVCSSPVHAESDGDDGWVKIAEKKVAFKAETDKVTPAGKERNVSKIKIKCVQGTVKLHEVRVEMDDGTKKAYDAKGVGVLTEGMSSFAFKLPGDDTKLKAIELDYDSVGAMVVSKKAKVEIWGLKRER